MSDTAHHFLLKNSKEKNLALHKIIKLNGQIDIPKQKVDSAFEFLFKTCVGQQLSAKAAASIWSRVLDLSQLIGGSLSALAEKKYSSQLRSCGLSNNKVRSILELKQRFEEEPGFSSDIHSADYKGVIDLICSNWGFGVWSADMCAIFFCGLQNVFPSGDVAINNGLRSLREHNAELDADFDFCSPYKSYLCLHIWRAIDSGHLLK